MNYRLTIGISAGWSNPRPLMFPSPARGRGAFYQSCRSCLVRLYPQLAQFLGELLGALARRLANGKTDKEPTDASYRWATDPDPVNNYTQ